MKRAAPAFAALLMCAVVVSACGSSPAKHVAAGTKTDDTSTTTPGTETTTSATATASSSGSVSGGTSGTATITPNSHPPTTARAGSVPTSTMAPTTSTTRSVAAGSTGVRGVVTAGPTCPAQRPGDPSCDDKPVPAHLLLQRGDGSTAASGDAGSDGQFFIASAAGSYTLTATSPNAMRCSSQPVTVSSGHVTDVHVSCDTGIR